MRKQSILINNIPTQVFSNLLAKQSNGTEYPSDCYLDEPDGNGLYLPSFEKILVQDDRALRAIFSAALDGLVVKYSQAEINTFSQKSKAANAYKAGAASDLQLQYLATLVGIDIELAGISELTAENLTLLDTEADRILSAESSLAYFTAKVEQVYKAAKGELVLGADNSALLNELSETYKTLLNY